ncbi:transcriptional regulator [Marinococcus halophilus]|uniref:LacI family transcriptional regulator n=1 Tax=Marinococcus halophilus TaxID=1371 RepID=A0A510Y9T4_MARHA|nr:LacI family DNA-binding transcriptional regulator [Marinococcus halophilus]OZT79103.1 transcriptional regulator [Marinococcus halophilus]GEK59913.1 LacI family transcriptional regulator [Marinococcus halophilus]
MATIKEVAKATGVSVATISRVLNNNGYVSEETKNKVIEAIKELDYRPNEVARSLYHKQSKTISLILPDITNPFFPELARGVEDIMNDHGYTIFLGNSDEKANKEERYLDMMEQKHVDGAILATNTLDSNHLKTLKKPVVIIDRSINSDFPTVCSENFHSSQDAVRHLKEVGCKVIAHIEGPAHITNSVLRKNGYIEVVKKESWFTDEYIVNGHYNDKDAYQATLTLLKNHPEIDGIFAGNDLMATGVLKAARNLGISIPEQLAVIGFDGIRMSEITSPELTTMAQPIYKMGETAAYMLIDLIEQRPLRERYYKYPVQLIKRQSTNVQNQSIN